MNSGKPVPRLLGKGPKKKGVAERRPVFRAPRGDKSTPDPLEAKREQAAIQSTEAKIVMTRRRAERLRDSLVDQDKSQSEVTTATVELIEMLRGARLSEETIRVIGDDLGDLAVEALRVTR